MTHPDFTPHEDEHHVEDARPAGEVVRIRPPSLPDTAAELKRKSLRKPGINEAVDEMFLPLYDSNPEFRKLLDAVWNSDAVEGHLHDDDTRAAEIIRKAAAEDSVIKQTNTATIRKAMGVVMRRYGIGRAERKKLAGEIES